jgi:PPK2 family polyphosphate:nucleotide phosphotransferase
MNKEELKEKLLSDTEAISNLQRKLYAENRQSLLIILQGMDGSGKDGTIKHIMTGINPQGVDIHSFKRPSALELQHDFLWRHAVKMPEHGQITIFNRSHYENVLISKVHPEIILTEKLPGIDSTDKITKKFWAMRYDQINDFEKRAIQNGTQILKFFLHLSKQEQGRRFLERIEIKEKNWKYSMDDLIERKFWSAYQTAFEEAIKHTSTKSAPWYIIPADDKMFAHLLISKIILEKLKKMDPAFPTVSEEDEEQFKKAEIKLKKEIKQ